MSKKCAICGKKVGFFKGKFIADKYVCRACYELNEIKKLSEPKEDDDSEKYPWTKIAEAYSKPCSTYKPWSWGNNKKSK